MSLSTNSLAQRRLVLRQQLQDQRLLIGQRLEPDTSNGAYPRSLTMGFLIARPALATQVLSQVATLLVGGRLIRSLGSALLVARLVHRLALKRRQRLLLAAQHPPL